VNLVLIGFMGVGKTSVGMGLAERLRRPFIDTDSLIEEAYSLPITRIFEKHGEASFRETERRVVEEVGNRRRCVIATGGGVVLWKENVECLRRRGLLVHLTLSPETIFRRIGHETERPLLNTDNPRQTLETLFRSRDRLYRACSDFTIDRDGLGVDETVERVLALAALHGLTSKGTDGPLERK